MNRQMKYELNIEIFCGMNLNLLLHAMIWVEGHFDRLSTSRVFLHNKYNSMMRPFCYKPHYTLSLFYITTTYYTYWAIYSIVKISCKNFSCLKVKNDSKDSLKKSVPTFYFKRYFCDVLGILQPKMTIHHCYKWEKTWLSLFAKRC